jgi:dihydrofolate synthase/folylpolyglutamate synthase
MLNNYEEAIHWLFQQFPSYQNIGASAYKPGLERVESLLFTLGNPEKGLKFIHVAGTNGKGSTSSYIASYLTESDEKVGLFTSPHIFDFRERIRINGNKISENHVVAFCNKIINANLEFEPSFFEITFAMAISYFNLEKCSYCVIETGLGGRLDATNVIAPLISVITNIGLDHTQFLGNTITEIATEKAGIIKVKTPVVIGESNLETKNVFESIALKNSTEIYFAENEQLPKTDFLPKYQQRNLRTAIKALNIIGIEIENEILLKSIDNLFNNTGLFGRMTQINKDPNVILDVSHNQDGIKATLNALSSKIEGNFHVIIGASSDKNLSEMIDYFPQNALINLCKFKNERSFNLEQLNSFKSGNSRIIRVFNNVNSGISELKKTMTSIDTLLITGSFFLIADVEL